MVSMPSNNKSQLWISFYYRTIQVSKLEKVNPVKAAKPHPCRRREKKSRASVVVALL